jgi:acyl-CoA synthetase (AMP-forming)/AMP-acid ligase II
MKRALRFFGPPLLLGKLTETVRDLYGGDMALHLEMPMRYRSATVECLTYRELHDLTVRFAGVLAASGVTPGQRVVVATSNRVDLLLLCLAIMRLGAIAVPLNHRLRSDEILYVIGSCAAETLILDRAVHVRAFGAAWPIRCAERVLFAGPAYEVPEEAVSIDAALGRDVRDAPSAPTRPDDACAILYTSGTSGLPRGAVHTSASLLAQLRFGLLCPRSARNLIVVSLPLAHIMGFTAMLMPLIAGVPISFLDEFSATKVLDAIQRRHATMFVGVPTMYQLLAEAGLDRFDLTTVRVWISAADQMPERLIAEFRRRGAFWKVRRWHTPAMFVDVYGSVELGGAVMARVFTSRLRNRASPLGIMLPGCRVRILDETGRKVPCGTVGELSVLSPSSFRGYINDPESTPHRLGWVRTGDLARQTRVGFVHFVARGTDLIKTGGYSVYPAEIERVLLQHADVELAVAFGLPDPLKAETPAAVVALFDGSPLTGEQLVAFARARLADYKAPRYVFVLRSTEIPVGRTGKISRSALAARLGGHVSRTQPPRP